MSVSGISYEDSSPLHIYMASCVKYKCRKNAHLLSVLPDQRGRLDLLTEIDLTLTLVGKTGIKAVMDIVKACRNVQRLGFADNSLNNDSVQVIVDTLWEHPAVKYLDLSRNPISHAGGKLLNEFVNRNQVISTILLEDTLINPALVRIIQERAQENGEAQKPRAPPPPVPVPVPPALPPQQPPEAPQPAGAAKAPREPAAEGSAESPPAPQSDPQRTGDVVNMLVAVTSACEAPQTGLPEWWGLRCVHALLTGGTAPSMTPTSGPVAMPPALGSAQDEQQGAAHPAAEIAAPAAPSAPSAPSAPAAPAAPAAEIAVAPSASLLPDGDGLRLCSEVATVGVADGLLAVLGAISADPAAHSGCGAELRSCLDVVEEGHIPNIRAALGAFSDDGPPRGAAPPPAAAGATVLLPSPPKSAPPPARPARPSGRSSRALSLEFRSAEGSVRLVVEHGAQGPSLGVYRNGVFEQYATLVVLDVASRRISFDRHTAPRARDAVAVAEDEALGPLVAGLAAACIAAGVPHALDCFTAEGGALLRVAPAGPDAGIAALLVDHDVAIAVLGEVRYDPAQRFMQFTPSNGGTAVTHTLPSQGVEAALAAVRAAVAVVEGTVEDADLHISRRTSHLSGRLGRGSVEPLPWEAARLCCSLGGDDPALRMLTSVLNEPVERKNAVPAEGSCPAVRLCCEGQQCDELRMLLSVVEASEELVQQGQPACGAPASSLSFIHRTAAADGDELSHLGLLTRGGQEGAAAALGPLFLAASEVEGELSPGHAASLAALQEAAGGGS